MLFWHLDVNLKLVNDTLTLQQLMLTKDIYIYKTIFGNCGRNKSSNQSCQYIAREKCSGCWRFPKASYYALLIWIYLLWCLIPVSRAHFYDKTLYFGKWESQKVSISTLYMSKLREIRIKLPDLCSFYWFSITSLILHN